MEDNNYERFLISKNKIILELNKDFLNLIGYRESELVGMTLIEAGKLLRIDSQVDLEDIEVATRIFIFTKELVPIEGIISCKIIDKGAKKIFSFQKDPLQCANQSFNLANQLGASREDAVAIITVDNLLVINNNDKHLDFHEPPYNKRMNTIGKKLIEILPKSLYDLFNKMKNHVINTANTFYAEELKLDLSTLGETYWNISLVPILENKINKYLILSLSNETEKVLNRESLKQRNKELETIMENISDEILIFDKDFNVDLSSINVEDNQLIPYEEARLLKTQKELLTKIVESMELEYARCTYPELEIINLNDKAMDKLKKINNEIKSDNCPIGRHCFELYPLNVERKIESIDFHLIEKEKCSYTDYQNYIVDGEERFFKTINEPIFGLDNKIIEIIFITKDITEEVKEKNKMEETLEMQNQIFATISHELKTPLNVIFSAAQLIERNLQGERANTDKEDISKKISIIKQNCYRFTKLINNIIDLSRMESGFYRLSFSNVNIVEIIEDIVDSVSSYVENTGLRIIFDTDVEEKIMAVDVDKMERVILNLISNAVKFSPKGENIYINIEDKGDYVLVLVRDCGVGIEEKHLNTIFDRYKKVDNSLYKNAEGSGLGLSLVEMILKSVGGEISVESELGKGSVFTMKIPVEILDESEVIDNMEYAGAGREQLNIEFSDIC